MSRMRSIKPTFFTNETLAELDPLTRVLFIGLWCIADREGRLEDRPKRIRAEVLPYDDGSVDAMLQALHDAGFILRYEAGGHRYIQVVNFAKHQRPHVRESASDIPAPGQAQPRQCTGTTKAMPSTLEVENGGGEWRMENGGGGDARRAESVRVVESPPPPPPDPTPIEDPITRQIVPILRTPRRDHALLAQVITKHRGRGLTAEDINIEAQKLAAKDGKVVSASSFDRWLEKASPGTVLLRAASNGGPNPHTAVTAEQANPFRARGGGGVAT